ncbi:immune-associated nucleotide-binding protein 1 [Elysia marginata]|uniref:Immune-associated nucleotide-binding protein 1 n=1 Tax=Elysia marginata TaxID=1093978 RepID=A0AAV4EUM0_9GAST|nr:immune-associated nucleotide-binding protein 1 [Elysia marginata]
MTINEEEDVEALDISKTILKPDFIKNHCILVITGEDFFQLDNKKTGKTFEKWVEEQTGKFAELVRECGNRVVQFDNRTEDKDKQQAQLDRLLTEVNKLQQTNGVYTDENFERAKALRERQKSEAKGAVIEEIALEEFRLLLDKVLYSEHNDLPDASSRCAQLIISLEKSNKDGKLDGFVGNLKVLKEIIDNTFRVVQTLPEEGDKRRKLTQMKLDGQIHRMHDHVQSLEQVYNELKWRQRALKGELVSAAALGMVQANMIGAVTFLAPGAVVLAPLALVSSFVLMAAAVVVVVVAAVVVVVAELVVVVVAAVVVVVTVL